MQHPGAADPRARFLEGIHHNARVVELRTRGLGRETERRVEIQYKDVVVGRHRLDIVVAGRLGVEIKVVAELTHSHSTQVRSYLKATGQQTARRVNFPKSMADIRRIEL